MVTCLGVEELAQANLRALAGNSYPGRLLVVGLRVLVYVLTGRSDESKNRVLVMEDGQLRTAIADPTKSVGDQTLTLYTAMALSREAEGIFVVSNGDQTKPVLECLEYGGDLAQALRGLKHEPDKSSTPRIVGAYVPQDQEHPVQLGIVRRSPCTEHLGARASSDRTSWGYSFLPSGYGYCVSTYRCDGDPYILPLHGSAKEIAQTIWAALNERNRVAAAAWVVSENDDRVTSHIINRFEQKLAPATP